MNRFPAFLLILTITLSFAACKNAPPAEGQVAPPPPSTDGFPEDHLSLATTTADLRFLASDELMGRAPGTPGGAAAARYIAEQFRAAGLKTVPGATEFYQPIPFSQTTPPAEGTLQMGETRYTQGESMLQLAGGAVAAEASVVFAGFGTAADLDGLDLEGKIVVTRFGTPEDQGPQAGFAAGQAKRTAVTEGGAVALVELYSGSFAWIQLRGFLNRPRFIVDQNADGIPHFLTDDTGGTHAEQMAQMPPATANLTTSGLGRKAMDSPNVLGMVEGNDPALRNEFVVLTAHYDHLGAGLNHAGATPADSIFNGARDNGMGTVALMNAARALGARPPARSVLFIALAAEESGLLGSHYYVDNPLIPLEDIVFVLNVDTGGYTDTEIVSVIGLERTTAEAAISAGTAAYDLKARPDPVPDQNLFNRSDNVSFAAKGIPAPTFSPGFHDFGKEIMKTYHQASDEAGDDFDYVYLLRFSQAYAHATRLIADMPERPFWVEGDDYEAAGKKLYGME